MKLQNSLAFKVFVFMVSLALFFYSSFIVLNYLNAEFNPLLFNPSTFYHNNPELAPLENHYPFENRQYDTEAPNGKPLNDNHDNDLQEKSFAMIKGSIDFINSEAGSMIWPIVCFFLIFAGMIFLSFSLGWQSDNKTPYFSVIHKAPIDIMGFLFIFSFILNTVLGLHILQFLTEKAFLIFPEFFLLFSLILTIDFSLVYTFYLLIVAQIKMQSLIRSSFIYLVFHAIFHLLKSLFLFFKNLFLLLPSMTKEFVGLLLFVVADGIGIYWYISQTPRKIVSFIFLLLLNIIFIYFNIRFFRQFKIIKKAIFNLANEHFNQPVNEKKMTGDFKEIAKALNHLDAEINAAISEKTKSELFKTELITNVSHDIKTPLTSIIMYIDLLERENIDNVNAQKYLAVLAKQSDRLKHLIEDLIEASKIATNNIKVSLVPLNLNQFLAQMQAEYDDKLQQKNLKLIISIPNEIQMILADTQYFIRVFDNLFSNILKYALADTRIYLDVMTRDKNNINIRLTNVSAEPLSLSAEQLMERFVQGDSSRSRKGSGIGLSIARSLMEAQNGYMNIKVDADLFTVDLKIPKYTNETVRL